VGGDRGWVPKQRVGAQRIVLICAHKPRNKPISCISQAVRGGVGAASGRGCAGGRAARDGAGASGGGGLTPVQDIG